MKYRPKKQYILHVLHSTWGLSYSKDIEDVGDQVLRQITPGNEAHPRPQAISGRHDSGRLPRSGGSHGGALLMPPPGITRRGRA